jgi:hypothetical protein
MKQNGHQAQKLGTERIRMARSMLGRPAITGNLCERSFPDSAGTFQILKSLKKW